jgi:hypothetical protein
MPLQEKLIRIDKRDGGESSLRTLLGEDLS